MGLQTENKAIVAPGEVLATGMDFLPGTGTYRSDDKILAGRVGLVSIAGRAIKLIPLSGRYIPKKGDVIIGKVIDIAFSGWRLELNSAYSAMLSVKDATSEFINRGADLAKYHNLGDYMVTKIVNVTSQKLVDVTLKGPGLKKLGPGRLIEVNTNKVPRIIGKQGSMVSLIKNKTNTQIVVGQNGWVWVSGNEAFNELIAIKTIKKIEAEAHISGLTDKISAFLDEEMKSAPKPAAPAAKPQAKPEQPKAAQPKQ